MDYTQNKKSIKYHIKQFLLHHANEIKGKTIVDFPAGNGITSSIAKELGGKVLPFDLFTEYFKEKDLVCHQADIMQGIPLEDDTAHWVICQEGMEHFPNQHKAFKEFNRILKNEGILIITTPNHSNLRSKFSYLLGEMERFNKTMPMNEMDSVWMSPNVNNKEPYFGHVFLIGIMKLRLLAKLNGFDIEEIIFTRMKTTSLLLMPFFYPFILLFNSLTYLRNAKSANNEQKKAYKQVYLLSINPKILLDGHLFVVFKKNQNASETIIQKNNVDSSFGLT